MYFKNAASVQKQATNQAGHEKQLRQDMAWWCMMCMWCMCDKERISESIAFKIMTNSGTERMNLHCEATCCEWTWMKQVCLECKLVQKCTVTDQPDQPDQPDQRWCQCWFINNINTWWIQGCPSVRQMSARSSLEILDSRSSFTIPFMALHEHGHRWTPLDTSCIYIYI